MQDGTKTVISPEMLKPLIIRSLRRSSVRKKIADYLFEISPSGSYTSEIAYSVKTTPTNVIGAIRGMNTRYRDDESLISLNLVEQIEGGKHRDINYTGSLILAKKLLKACVKTRNDSKKLNTFLSCILHAL